MKKLFSAQEDEKLIYIFITRLKKDFKNIDDQFLKYLQEEFQSTDLKVYFKKLYKIWWNLCFSLNDKDVKMKVERIKLIRKIRDEKFSADAFYYHGAPEYHITRNKERKRIKVKSKKDLKWERETKEINRLKKEYESTGDPAYLNKIGECIRKLTNTKEFVIGIAISNYKSEKKYSSKLFEHIYGILNSSKELVKFIKEGEINPQELKIFLKEKSPVIAIEKVKYEGRELHTEFNQSIRGEQKRGTMTLEKYKKDLEKFNFCLLLF
jgi:hypothetical protein